MELLARTEWVTPVVTFVCAALLAVAVGYLLRFQKARGQRRYEDQARQNGRGGSGQ
jgi:hypothetical protein